MLKKFSYAVSFSAVIFLSGCASNASTDQMSYLARLDHKPKNSSFEHGIAVNQVTGGHETNPLWTSQIDNENFKEALSRSLEAAGLLSDGNNSKYILDAKLIKLDQPLLGFDMTVTSEINYHLTDMEQHKTIYDKTISSSYTATFKDSAIGMTRLKMANEGAARENIKKFIADLSDFSGKSLIGLN